MSWIRKGGVGSRWLQVAVLFVALSLNLYPCTAHTAKPGDLDTSFDSDGIVVLGGNNKASDIAKGLAIDSKGRIVVVGASNINGKNDFAVARFNSNGTLDESFGKGGVVTTDISAKKYHDSANAVAIDSNGNIVVVGQSNDGTDDDFVVVRYDINGILDIKFNKNGKVITDLSGKNKNDDAHAVAIDSNGKIVVAGVSNNGIDDDFAVVRLNIGGTLDTTFGKNGVVITDIDSANKYADSANAVVIESNGKIVVAGTTKGGTLDFAMARYNSDGTPDITFDTDGKTITPIGSAFDSASGVAIDSNGKIVVAGTAFSGTTYDLAIARYDSTGKLDESFGSKGKVITPIGSAYDSALALVIDSNGKIVTAGTTCKWLTFDCDFAVMRYDSTGKLDESFGSKGKVITPIGSATSSSASAAVIQPDGNIVVAGSILMGNFFDVALVRYIGDPVTKAPVAGTGSGVPTGGEGGAETAATTVTTEAEIETAMGDTETTAEDATGDTTAADATAAPSWGDGGCTLIPTP